MQPTEIAASVNQCFRFISIDVGYKRPADDAEWQYIVVRLADVLKRHFYDLTIEDVKTAFELLTVGDLDNYLPTNSSGEPDRSHYQNLNAEYLCKVLRAYKKRRDVAYTNIKAAQPKPQKALPPQPTKTPAEKTRECYDTYKATGLYKRGMVQVLRRYKIFRCNRGNVLWFSMERPRRLPQSSRP